MELTRQTKNKRNFRAEEAVREMLEKHFISSEYVKKKKKLTSLLSSMTEVGVNFFHAAND